MLHKPLPVAVIGAGFSGTLTALQLHDRLGGRPILLCERAAQFAKGVAYSTEESVHLLNVRAANMGAYPDRPRGFLDWLETQGRSVDGEVHETPAGSFATRGLFGRYLSSLLRDRIQGKEGAMRLQIVPEEVVELRPSGEGFLMRFAGGRKRRIAGAVLAVGNLLPSQEKDLAIVDNPWIAPFEKDLVRGKPVLVIGTSLTMVDVTMRLWAANFEGPVIALSRRGLLPHTHAATGPWPRPALDGQERTSLVQLLRRVRSEAEAAREAGLTWQSAVDSLRPVTPSLWQALPEDEQRRFLRHLQPWWDVHRHRMAPPIGQRVQALIERGYLEIRKGRILDMERRDGEVVVHYRPRGETSATSITVQRVINATGPVAAEHTHDPLIRSLLDGGAARLDRHRLGLEVTEALRCVDASGRVAPRLWAVGPIVRGTFWECTAVPEIRRQAHDIAESIAHILKPA